MFMDRAVLQLVLILAEMFLAVSHKGTLNVYSCAQLALLSSVCYSEKNMSLFEDKDPGRL